jgi:hypothetical protein
VPHECGAGTEPARPVSFAATGWRAIVQTIWAYLIRLTASRAGIAQADAERQVDEAIMGATSLQLEVAAPHIVKSLAPRASPDHTH